MAEHARVDTAVLREPVISRRLRIGREKVTLLDGDRIEAEHRPKGLGFRTEHKLLWDLERARHGHLPEELQLFQKTWDEAPSPDVAQHLILQQLGVALGEELLAGAAGEALGRVLAEAERLGAPLELALEPEDSLAGFPWEALQLPGSDVLTGQPLALHPNVRLFREVNGPEQAPAPPIPGPLRVLVAIGSPAAPNKRGELLDLEEELSRILDAVEPARRQGRAHVRVLERGTVPAIREALAAEPCHVLHLTCHAGPGVLVLETEEGAEDWVDASRFCSEVLVPGRVPVVVLAGCATDVSIPETWGPAKTRAIVRAMLRGGSVDSAAAFLRIPGQQRGEAALPGFARELLARGVPAVVAMQGPVSGPSIAELFARLYRTLAGRPDPLVAFAAARLSVEADRHKGELDDPGGPGEWATPALWLRGPSRPLYDPEAPFEEVQPVGAFAGRRQEKRQILHALAREDGAGVLLHGLGGVGTSRLAAEVLGKLRETGWLVASVHGEISPGDLLAEVGRWGDRPLILLLDHFADNLTDGGLGPTLKSEDLADLLARWVRNPGRSRLLFTSRRPFELPDHAHQRLETRHLGPLSWAETRELLWRLPGLDALDREARLRVHTEIGGHPRALEFLEASLRRANGDLDRALAEAAALARDDILLDRLLEKLEGVPLARELLLGASVFRIPVLRFALTSQLRGGLGENLELMRKARAGLARVGLEGRAEIFNWMQANLPEFGSSPFAAPQGSKEALEVLETLGLLAPVQWSDPPQEADLFVHRWIASEVLRRSPEDAVRRAHFRAARGPRQGRPMDDIRQQLEDQYHFREAGQVGQGIDWTDPICFVLRRRGAYRREEQLLREALERLPEGSQSAAEIMRRLGTVAWLRSDFDIAGAWYEKAARIFDERKDRQHSADTYDQLGTMAQERGDHEQALGWYQRALQLREELGRRAELARSYQRLGTEAEEKGDFEEALDWYRKAARTDDELSDEESMASQFGRMAEEQGASKAALDWYKQKFQLPSHVKGELGNRADMASLYHRLGMVAQARGDFDQALDWLKKSLQLAEELGNRAGMAVSYHQLGLLSQERGDTGQAADWSGKARQIEEELNNKYGPFIGAEHFKGAYEVALDWYDRALQIEELGGRSDLAISYYRRGVAAQDRGNFDQALEWYQKALQIFEELDRRAEMAGTISNLGFLATEQGCPEDGLPLNLRSLAIRRELQVPEVDIDLHWLDSQRKLLGAERFGELLREHAGEEAEAVLGLLAHHSNPRRTPWSLKHG